MRLALISKRKKDPELSTANRLLCMLDTTGKVIEKLISNRLAEAIPAVGNLSPSQFGFRARRFTVDVMMSEMPLIPLDGKAC